MMLPYLEGVCIDVAQGHHVKVAKLIKAIKNVTNLKVIAGNVATADGAKYLVDAGADAIKVGIGAGAVCTTRTVAGVGYPQLSSILEVADADLGVPLIGDGGVTSSADIAKALIAGASVVMIGSLIAGADECPGSIVVAADGTKWRKYRGQSIFGSNGERYVPEGIEGYVPAKGKVADILHNLQAGLRSSMSYVGAHNIKELQLKGKFTLVSPNTVHENATRVRQTI
jgi:IMP dehydrogenase